MCGIILKVCVQEGVYMKELGFIILENGKIIKFGEYYCTIYRNNQDKKHFHDSAFQEILSKYKKDFPFISDVGSFHVLESLPFLARNHCITVVNASSGSFQVLLPIMVMTTPENISASQKNALISVEKTMNYFDNGLSDIHSFSEDGQEEKSYSTIDDFYYDKVQYPYHSSFQPVNDYSKALLKRYQ